MDEIVGNNVHQEELKCRISLFGAANVGKSKIVNRLIFDRYTETYVPTLEEYYETIEEYGGVTLILQVVDTSGTQQFPAMRRLNMRKSNLVLLVYDISMVHTFDEVKRLYETCRNTTRSNVIIVGAKADFLPGSTPEICRKCIDDVNLYVRSRNDDKLQHILCSARTFQGVKKILEEGIKSVFHKIDLKLGANFWDRVIPQHQCQSHGDESSEIACLKCLLSQFKTHVNHREQGLNGTKPKIHQREPRWSATTNPNKFV